MLLIRKSHTVGVGGVAALRLHIMSHHTPLWCSIFAKEHSLECVIPHLTVNILHYGSLSYATSHFFVFAFSLRNLKKNQKRDVENAAMQLVCILNYIKNALFSHNFFFTFMMACCYSKIFNNMVLWCILMHPDPRQCYCFHPNPDHFPITACSVVCYSSYPLLVELQFCV